MEQKEPHALLVLTCLSNKAACKYTVAAVGVRKISNYFAANREHYQDFFKFNFNSVKEEVAPITKVNYRNVPAEESKRLRGIYKHFGFCEEEEIFKKLGTIPTVMNSSSPVEAKWAYEYVKKFKTTNYLEANHVSDAEILTPLKDFETQAYLKITK